MQVRLIDKIFFLDLFVIKLEFCIGNVLLRKYAYIQYCVIVYT